MNNIFLLHTIKCLNKFEWDNWNTLEVCAVIAELKSKSNFDTKNFHYFYIITIRPIVESFVLWVYYVLGIDKSVTYVWGFIPQLSLKFYFTSLNCWVT